MSGGSKLVRGFTHVVQNLNHPEMMVVGAPPPPYSITWLLFFGATSQKLRGRVRGLSRSVYALPGASKKQSPPASGIGSGMPSTLSQQLPRASIPKWAKWNGGPADSSECLSPATLSSTGASVFSPQGAVAS